MSFSLKPLRQRAGLTLEDLARATGLTRSYVSKIERGLSSPSVGVAIKLAQALDTPVEQLFGATSSSQAVSITRNPGATGANGPRIVAGIEGDHRMIAFVLTPGRQKASKPRMNDHKGEEILYVLSGEAQLHIAGRTEHLRAGDCAQFDGSIPHRVEATEAGNAEVLLVTLKP